MTPWIGVILFSIRIDGAASLKDRRQVVRSLLDRVSARFNASVADLGPDGVWDRCDFAVSCVGSSSQEVETRIARMDSFIAHMEESGEFEITAAEREVFSYGDV